MGFYLDSKFYVDGSVLEKISFLKARTEEIMQEDIEDGEALEKIYRLITLLPDDFD